MTPQQRTYCQLLACLMYAKSNREIEEAEACLVLLAPSDRLMLIEYAQIRRCELIAERYPVTE